MDAVILKAKERLEKDWTVGDIGGPVGPCCAIGGLCYATDAELDPDEFPGFPKEYLYPDSMYCSPELKVALQKVYAALPEDYIEERRARRAQVGLSTDSQSVNYLTSAIYGYNDSHTKEEVLELFERAAQA